MGLRQAPGTLAYFRGQRPSQPGGAAAIFGLRSYLLIYNTIGDKYKISSASEIKERLMDPKLVRQFIIFLVILFGWTAVLLLAGPK